MNRKGFQNIQELSTFVLFGGNKPNSTTKHRKLFSQNAHT